jgi:prevent-host-death family protein
MARKWQLQEAKNKLSEVIRCARTEGPQEITVRGEPAVVVISAEEYEKTKPTKHKNSAWEWLYDPDAPKFSDEEMETYFGRRDDFGRDLPEFGQ